MTKMPLLTRWLRVGVLHLLSLQCHQRAFLVIAVEELMKEDPDWLQIHWKCLCAVQVGSMLRNEWPIRGLLIMKIQMKNGVSQIVSFY
jgi:hypothetical protein